MSNSCLYESGKVRTTFSGVKSAVTMPPIAEFCRAISAFLKSMAGVRYSSPVGTSDVSANPFIMRVALDLSMDSSSGGSALVVSPFLSSSSRRDWGIEFSITPSSVKRNMAIASPFLLTVISSEFAVNACAGITIKKMQQASIRQQRFILFRYNMG